MVVVGSARVMTRIRRSPEKKIQHISERKKMIKLTVARGVKNCGLHNNKWGVDLLFDLYLNGIRLILRYGRHGKKVGGPNKKVPVE
jgi:hypothetical protein